MDAKTIDQCQVPITPDNIPSQLKKLNCFIRWRYFNDGNDSNKQYAHLMIRVHFYHLTR